MTRRIALLGPQRHHPTVRDALDELGIHPPQPVAVVTAGWEEREPEDLELGEHLRAPVVNLRVYDRAEDIYRRDPELHEAMRERHDWLRQLQEIYMMRLAHALEAARELLRRDGDVRLLTPEREDAIAAVRTLDAHHLARVRAVHEEFDHRWRPWERDVVAHHRGEIARALDGVAALCIAGGHVPILLNRTRLLGVLDAVSDRPIVAWSGGAMILSEQIVLFHDSPPEGEGDAQVLVPALGLAKGLLPLPHASRRLRLHDTLRVGLFARRFAPLDCLALDEHTWMVHDGQQWHGRAQLRRLTASGRLEEVAA